ncbi:MAG: universal stress protein, partial [Planctomycetes bacterium]|nr:universal stress protein [Planctomycetota bacterium]
LPRIPRFLLPRLEERGIRYQYLEQADATALIWIGKP